MVVQRRRAWNVVVGACICFTMLIGFTRCFGIFYSAIMEKYNTTSTGAASFMSVQSGVRTVAAPGAWLLTRRLGFQLAMIFGGLVFSAGIITSVLYPSLVVLNITLGGISGLGAAIIYVVPFMSINHSFMGDSWHSLAMSLATLGAGIGTLSFGPINEVLLSTYGYNGALLITGAIMLNICVGGALLGDPYHKLEALDPSEHTVLLAEDTSQSSPATNSGSLLANGQDDGLKANEKHAASGQPRFLVKMTEYCVMLKEICTVQLCLYMICMFVMMTVVFSSLLFLDKLCEELQLASSSSAMLLFIMGITDMIGRCVIGGLFDAKYIRARRPFWLAMAGFLTGLITFVLGVTSNYTQLMVSGAIYGFLGGGYGSQTMTAVCDLVPHSQMHQAVSFTIAFQGVGQFLGPVFQGLLVDYFQTYRIVYISSGFALALFSLLTALHCCWQECSVSICVKEYKKIDKV